MNPLLPLEYFVPDVEARQWNDGRLYLYGSYDFSANPSYCSREYRVFSSTDLVHWTDHGVSFRSSEAHAGQEFRLYAPDCVRIGTDYCLFYCLANKGEGMAVSRSPVGPFGNAVGIGGADGDGIDPAVLVDDDGQVYYFWGQHRLRGARLDPRTHTIDDATLQPALLNEKEHGFHEGASLRKRNGLYYLVYTDISRGRATSMGYAVSRSPLGPFEKRGILIDNTGCDPETWNNHGSIAAFNGKWYLFYHRSSQGSRFSRRVCIEPIVFRDNGDIDEVEMTTQGASGPLEATRELEACRACLLSGRVRTGVVGPGPGRSDTDEHLTQIIDGDWAAYKRLDFGGGVSAFQVRAGSLAYGGALEVRLDAPDGPLAGTCAVTRTGGWQQWETFTCPIDGAATGIRALYLVFRGAHGRLFDLKSFRFVG